MSNNRISVLMSVYKSEKALLLKEAVESMVFQTHSSDEIVIVEDGPLTNELYETLDELVATYPTLIRRLPLETNQGLGLALKYGVNHCRYPLIARMDTDDIAIPERLALQLKVFQEEPELDMVGGYINEFIDNPANPISQRRVPLIHEDIVRYQRMRSAFNHMTVMFKKEAVLKAGNYENGLYMEDDLLWLNMISSGARLRNLNQVLCNVRTGEGMYERRGGIAYLKHYRHARQLMYKRGQISFKDYHLSVMIQALVALVPTSIRKFIFVNLLRRKSIRGN